MATKTSTASKKIESKAPTGAGNAGTAQASRATPMAGTQSSPLTPEASAQIETPIGRCMSAAQSQL